MPNFTRRQFVYGLSAIPLLLRDWPAFAQGQALNFTVDFDRIVAQSSPQNLGICCTTYGATAISSEVLAQAENSLDFRRVRIPIGYRDGRVTTSAQGAPTTLDIPRLVDWYRERNIRVLAVLGGRTTDIDIAPGDAKRIANAIGTDGIDFSSVNEPNTKGVDEVRTLRISRQILAELRQLEPELKLWGPVWAWYQREALENWAKGMAEGFGGLSYHHYGMGTNSLPTAQALAETATFGREVREMRGILRALNLPEKVAVTEMNFSWRFDDGTPPDGKNRRFFSAVNTVWCASVYGHILSSGGSANIYGNQNGPLGVWSQPNEPHLKELDLPDFAPMPAYRGAAAWTGARNFPHFKDSFYEVKGTTDTVELFAANNEANGYNLVLINKSESETHSLEIELKNCPPTTFALCQSNRTQPFAAPQQTIRATPTNGKLNIALPPLTVATAVLQPH
ncbi:hypothetical protein EON83_06810 [bacterium]|nr:MAG: hypothetical protein EON83_06810 [bacterium]